MLSCCHMCHGGWMNKALQITCRCLIIVNTLVSSTCFCLYMCSQTVMLTPIHLFCHSLFTLRSSFSQYSAHIYIYSDRHDDKYSLVDGLFCCSTKRQTERERKRERGQFKQNRQSDQRMSASIANWRCWYCWPNYGEYKLGQC